MTRRFLILVMALLLVPAATAFGQDSKPKAKTKSHKKHHVKKKSHKGAKAEYGQGGKDMGHGGKKLAHNVKHGRVVEGGKELGKGVYQRLVGSLEDSAEDGSTQGLINYFRGRHRG